jgi:hypothetical protein
MTVKSAGSVIAVGLSSTVGDGTTVGMGIGVAVAATGVSVETTSAVGTTASGLLHAAINSDIRISRVNIRIELRTIRH